MNIFQTLYQDIKNTAKVQKSIKSSLNAQGQVIASMLSRRLIAVNSWICLPHYHHGTSFTQTNLKTASENILMAHPCKAHTGQIDGMLWL